MNIEVEKFSWSDIEKICIDFKERCDFNFEYIIAITRGGWIPSVILSHYFGIRKVIPFQIYETEDDAINSKKNKPLIGNNLNFKFIKNKTCLIVDDIFGTGATLHEVGKIIKKYTTKTKSFVCVMNDSNYKNEYNLPDFIGKHVSKWVIFPWEDSNER